MTKALVLLSGGLDSRLVIKILQEQNIKITALHFLLPFSGCCKPDCVFNFAQLQNVPLKIIDCRKGKNFDEYIKLIKKPKYGYGSGTNPCIDCRIFMLKKAKEFLEKEKTDFIATGEVLGERPMSQYKKAMKLAEKEAGLEGRILRPLSAKLLPETEVERKGLVNRDKLLAISGRSRKEQIALAEKYKISYPSPAGGCLLCEKAFASRLKDLFEYKKKIKPRDIELLKYGRHFRLGKSKIVVGRNKEENQAILKLKNKSDYVFEVPNVGSPITLLQGKITKSAIEIAARITARYSDETSTIVKVCYGKGELNKNIKVVKLDEESLNKIRL